MKRNIRLWSIDGSLENATELTTDKWTEKEEDLEKLLALNPEILMPGLKLVARQAPTDNGFLDLLGIDNIGRMIVFELKREKLARDSVAQIVDYTSYLDSLSEDGIADYIVEHSGKNDIEKIDDFQNWYEERYGNSEAELRPTRMMLVSFDADTAAQRMVEFLNERGVAIAIHTLSKYKSENETLLVGHHDRTMEARTGIKKAEQTDEEKMSAINARANELKVGGYWESVVNALSVDNFLTPRNNRPPRKSVITFWRRSVKLSDEGGIFRGSHSVLLEGIGTVKVTFFPVSVHLCYKLFSNSSISFEQEQSRNAPTTEEVEEQWYCILDEKEWGNHKEEVAKLATEVSAAWEKKRRSAGAL